jgi:hypothetical protein
MLDCVLFILLAVVSLGRRIVALANGLFDAPDIVVVNSGC